ncbi:Uncharacterised protein [uncultured Comamonas sp.]|nr:Uncharacterised protein [uncultured Comamonas sp.]
MQRSLLLPGRALFHCFSAVMTDPQPSPPSDAPAPLSAAKALAVEDWLVVILMALLALITFANVLVRYFTDASFAWTEEISVFLMIVLAMVGGSSAVARDQHIRIEFFSGQGSVQRRRRLARLGALMVALLFTVLAVLSVRLVWDDWRYEETSPGIGVPQWWYSIWLPVCSIAIALRAVGLFLRQGRPGAFEPEIITDADGQGGQP